MSELTLRTAVAARLLLAAALERGRTKRRENPESGEILSTLLLAVGLVALAVGIVTAITLWANGKLGAITSQ